MSTAYQELSNMILFSMLMRHVLRLFFCNICGWFVDNKLWIHFGKNKTKWILFASIFKMKNVNIEYGDIRIRQPFKVKCLGCLFNETKVYTGAI